MITTTASIAGGALSQFQSVANLVTLRHASDGVSDLSGLSIEGATLRRFDGSSGADGFAVAADYAKALTLNGGGGNERWRAEPGPTASTAA